MLLYYALFIFFFSLSDEMRYSLVMRHVGLVCVHSLAINNRAKVIGAVLILNCEVGREGMWWRAGRRGCESREQIGKQSERQTDRQGDGLFLVCVTSSKEHVFADCSSVIQGKKKMLMTSQEQDGISSSRRHVTIKKAALIHHSRFSQLSSALFDVTTPRTTCFLS